jgi:hypothetical protein
MRKMPFALLLFAQPTDQILKMLGDALINVSVVHRSQQFADPHLSLSPKANFRFMRTFAHWILRLRLVRSRLDRLKIGLLALHHVTFPRSPMWMPMLMPMWIVHVAPVPLITDPLDDVTRLAVAGSVAGNAFLGTSFAFRRFRVNSGYGRGG